jgi:hypothetical protein
VRIARAAEVLEQKEERGIPNVEPVHEIEQKEERGIPNVEPVHEIGRSCCKRACTSANVTDARGVCWNTSPRQTEVDGFVSEAHISPEVSISGGGNDSLRGTSGVTKIVGTTCVEVRDPRQSEGNIRRKRKRRAKAATKRKQLERRTKLQCTADSLKFFSGAAANSPASFGTKSTHSKANAFSL